MWALRSGKLLDFLSYVEAFLTKADIACATISF